MFCTLSYLSLENKTEKKNKHNLHMYSGKKQCCIKKQASENRCQWINHPGILNCIFTQAATRSQPVKQGPFTASLCSANLTTLKFFFVQELVSKEKKKEP